MDRFNQSDSTAEKKCSVFVGSKKKRPPTKLVNRNEKEGVRATLQRGKLPVNWNSFLEQQATASSTKPKKYPRQYTKVYISSRYANSENAVTVNMPKSQGSNGKVLSTGRCVAIDCEMVGVGDGKENMLARVSMVDENGTVVYDSFVKPQQRVIDYRTPVSGVRPLDMANGKDFSTVQVEVYDIMKGKVLIGHALRNDLKVLYLSHPKHSIRDTSKFKTFREEAEGRTPSLRLLAMKLLGLQIQQGEHSSVEDARAAMALYMLYRNSWESELRTKWSRHTQHH